MTTASPERLTVPEDLDGSRLDRALAQLVRDHSRERLREMIEDGRVTVEGTCVRKPSVAVVAGQVLEIELVPRDRTRRGSDEGAELRIVHQDEHVAVVEKPFGMVAHPSSVVRGGTVSELAVERFGPLPDLQGVDRPGIVHRLDKDTSGVMVLALTEVAGRELMRQFKEREVEKTYLALVDGDPRFDSDWVTAPIGRRSQKSERMAVFTEEDLEEWEGESPARPAETFYRVLERYGEFALLDCSPKTGRTHQIRVHMAHIGHSIVADPLYKSRQAVGRKLPAGAPKLRRQALHAYRLEFTHPATGERVRYEVEPPADMAALIAFFRERVRES